MNLLIQELAYKKLKFLLIPAGTANDLARELGLVESISESILAIRKSCARKIDLIDINGKLFATNGGMGIGADVTGIINSIRQRFPQSNTLLKIFKHKIYAMVLSYFSLRPQLRYYKLEVNAKEFKAVVETPFVFILNQATVAGDIRLLPDSENSDGLFHVVIFSHSTRTQLLRCFVQILLGKIPHDDPNYKSFCTAQVTFRSVQGDKVCYFGDGEVLGESKTVQVKILPQALDVFVPQKEKL
jgi:diacylglycerol kinase family enzyme